MVWECICVYLNHGSTSVCILLAVSLHSCLQHLRPSPARVVPCSRPFLFSFPRSNASSPQSHYLPLYLTCHLDLWRKDWLQEKVMAILSKYNITMQRNQALKWHFFVWTIWYTIAPLWPEKSKQISPFWSVLFYPAGEYHCVCMFASVFCDFKVT